MIMQTFIFDVTFNSHAQILLFAQ